MSLERTKKSSLETLKTDLERQKKTTGYMLAQPIRVQPTKVLMGNEDIVGYLSRITEDEVKQWKTPRIFADTKIAGARALLMIDHDNRNITILSRTGKETTFKKFVDKYKDKLLDGIDWENVKGDIVLDGEIYAIRKRDGKAVSQGRTVGYARNPTDPSLKGKLMVFDILMVNDRDIRSVKLSERKDLLKRSVDEEGGVVEEVATAAVPPSRIEPTFRRAVNEGEEGIVIKDPNQPYMSGKRPELHWRKLKSAVTFDLELKEVSSWPRNKGFKFYRHLILVPGDDETHEIKADKGIRNAELGFEFWQKMSKKWLGMYDRGIIKGNGEVDVDADLVKFYGRKRVPKELIFPQAKRSIVEIVTEDMTDKLSPAGQKIVGFRDDKERADTMKDLSDAKKLFGKGE